MRSDNAIGAAGTEAAAVAGKAEGCVVACVGGCLAWMRSAGMTAGDETSIVTVRFCW
jgi:hypothetical protein